MVYVSKLAVPVRKTVFMKPGTHVQHANANREIYKHHPKMKNAHLFSHQSVLVMSPECFPEEIFVPVC